MVCASTTFEQESETGVGFSGLGVGVGDAVPLGEGDEDGDDTDGVVVGSASGTCARHPVRAPAVPKTRPATKAVRTANRVLDTTPLLPRSLRIRAATPQESGISAR